MSKAALIIDMPGSCLDCRFCREISEGIEACCEVMDEPNDNTLCRMIDCKDGYCQNKPEWCPLREVPQRRYYGGRYFNGDVKGWNDCLKEIMEENNK